MAETKKRAKTRGADSQFIDISQAILKQIQKVVEDIEKPQKEKIVTFCKQFMVFYQSCILKDEEEIQKFLNQYKLKSLNPTDDLNELIQTLNINKQINQIFASRIQRIRQLESLLTAFKHLFLKYINITLVQVVVVQIQGDDGTYKPELFEMGNYSRLATLIRSSLDQMQGKLKSNQDLLKELKEKERYKAANNVDIYVQVYNQTRRRLKVYYNRVRKGATSGTALLLYKPKKKWIKFRVNNLGDVKQGYVAMVMAQPKLNSKTEEKKVQIFAQNYISKVDNISGTLFQDVQVMGENDEIETLIAVKSGSAETGSHSGIIDLIYQIAKDEDLERIQTIFEAQSQKGEGFGQRNRVLTEDESVEKVANDMKTVVDKNVEAKLDSVIAGVKKIKR